MTSETHTPARTHSRTEGKSRVCRCHSRAEWSGVEPSAIHPFVAKAVAAIGSSQRLYDRPTRTRSLVAQRLEARLNDRVSSCDLHNTPMWQRPQHSLTRSFIIPDQSRRYPHPTACCSPARLSALWWFSMRGTSIALATRVTLATGSLFTLLRIASFLVCLTASVQHVCSLV